VRRLLTKTLLLTIFLVAKPLWAVTLQNLTVEPEFLCPGKSVTVSFQAEGAFNGASFNLMGDFTTIGGTSFNDNKDYLFMYAGTPNTNPIPPTNPNWGAVSPEGYTGNLVWQTYTYVTTVPSVGFFLTTGQQVYVNIAGEEAGFWPYDGFAGGMANLSVAVTVSCTEGDVSNTGVFGNSNSVAKLIIQQCGSTNTFTNTPTNTISPTVTNTPLAPNTATFTNTFTTTPTNTYTSTSTNTISPTVTNTPVDSYTFTNTFTITPTNTLTSTPTSTYSPTVTNTPVDTFTFTNTFTPTPSGTFTNTPQSTFTFTNTTTPTTTNTFTVTPTPTSFVGFGKTVSETEANAGDVLTYTIAVTVTGPSLTNPVITDVLPANITFQAFGTMPAGTTISQSPLQWTLPTTLADGVYDITYQTKVNAFAQANVPLTNNAQLTYSGLLNPMKASVPVTVIGQFSVSVNIYNSAGEVIKTIPIQQFSTAINNIVLSTTNTITTLTGPGNSIQILYNGYVIGIWNGTNNANQPVSNGSYRVQVDNISTSGTVTSVSQTAIVNRDLSSVEVDIYNGAGEIVRKLYNVVDNATSSNMTNVILSTTLLRPNPSNIPSSPTASQLQILVQDTISPVTLTWDGTDNDGTYVTPGQYEIQVHWTNGSGTTTDITRTIMVLPAAGVSGIAAAIPNVLGGKNGTTTTFNANGVLNASSLKVKIYTITGELVQSFVSGTTTAIWNASGIASGIYIAVLEIENANGGIVNQQRLKILVLH